MLPHWGDRPIEDIKRRDVIALLDRIVAAGTPHAATGVLKQVRKLFNWAIERDLLESSPCNSVMTPVKPVERDRTLNEDEIVDVWRAAEKMGYPLGTAFQLLLATGATAQRDRQDAVVVAQTRQ